MLPVNLMLVRYIQDVLRSGLLQNGSIAVQDESAGEFSIASSLGLIFDYM